MAFERREVRRSQLITTYGVGSVVATGDESFMIAGIDRWQADPTLHEPRLERELNVQGFAIPPATENGKDIPVVRFPVWQSCPTCDRLDVHGKFTRTHDNQCPECGVVLTPSRFVMACAKGHIDDFPYFLWVHKGQQPRGGQHEMKINTAGVTAGLGDITISCSCGLERTMEGAFDKWALKNITPCTGKRPWLKTDQEGCDEVPRTLQRGASNVWFAVTRSALSIPPWSKGAFQIINRHWPVFRVLSADALPETIKSMGLTDNTPYTVEDLVEAIRLRRRQEEGTAGETRADLRDEEYEALVRGTSGSQSILDQFICEPGEVSDRTSQSVEQVMLVKRLREVRVLESFTRVLPPSPADPRERMQPLFDEHPGWYPAIEVLGEGVFLRLNKDRLAQWEKASRVQERAATLDANYRELFGIHSQRPDRVITPRLLLIHALAHALINQWSLESGYPAASLRERLYPSGNQAGILIYTATSDSAGSLGGVVGLAEPERFDEALTHALAAARWCSMDPVCVESPPTGVNALNLAACHACMLLPEVSCEEQNVLLDRAMLGGTEDLPGYFSNWLEGT